MSRTGRVDLFVFGTLLTVSQPPLGDLLRANGHSIGAGAIKARLYEIDDPDAPGENAYPGAMPSPDDADRVYGEVYALTDPKTVLDAFDIYEACSPDHAEPHEFALRRVPVTMENGTTRWAVSYLYTWDVSTAQHIPSGRWTKVAPDVL